MEALGLGLPEFRVKGLELQKKGVVCHKLGYLNYGGWGALMLQAGR